MQHYHFRLPILALDDTIRCLSRTPQFVVLKLGTQFGRNRRLEGILGESRPSDNRLQVVRNMDAVRDGFIEAFRGRRA